MSEKILNGEISKNNIEGKEVAPKGREIELYLFRHAEASDQGVDAELTERGKEQAKEAAQNLVRQIIEQGGGVIKFLSSPVKRAKQTSEIMQQTIHEILSEQQVKNIRLMSPRDRETLKAAGVIGPLKQSGIDDPVDYWLRNPEILEGKSPSKIAERLHEIINLLQKVADRLSSGEKIYYIGVTHEVPQAALLYQTSGKTLNELGGNIQNCELMKIELKGKSEEGATIKFRDKEMKIENLDTEQNQ